MTRDDEVNLAMLRNALARCHAELLALKQPGAAPLNPSRIEAPDGWWVRAEDYDKLADAARRLRAECYTWIPTGWYDKLTSLSDLDEILRQQKDTCSPSTSTTPPQSQPDSAPPAGR